MSDDELLCLNTGTGTSLGDLVYVRPSEVAAVLPNGYYDFDGKTEHYATLVLRSGHKIEFQWAAPDLARATGIPIR